MRNTVFKILTMKRSYSVESLKSAIVEAGTGESSVHGVAKKYGVPSSMLHEHVHVTYF